MKTAARKAKGRTLQKWVVAQILKLLPFLSEQDVRSTPAGVNGPDVQLSERAQTWFPYSVECKNQESFKNVYAAFEQCVSGKIDGTAPLLIIKRNRKNPLVVVSAQQFFHTLTVIEELEKVANQ